MSLPLLAAIVLVALALGYRFYGGFVARQYGLDPGKKTPAHLQADGVDFVPTRPFYLFGQHFSAIAAAGPIVGPILACQQYGWLPCILWIGAGCIFIGAVHDFSALVASVRHDARSVAEVVKRHLGREAWLAILAFIWLALVYVLVAFADITAQTFVTGDSDTAALGFRFNRGGAVALAAVVYLGLAIVMGVVDRLWKPPLWLSTLIFVPLTVGAIWLGTQHSTLLLLSWKTWVILIMAYCFLASLSPMWLLLQPRGYLGGFVLYGTLIIGTIGIFSGQFDIQQPAFKGWGELENQKGATTLLFPFLFVTIACGACSGFHGLVCSGTTSKQIDAEPHCHPIGYGAMLLEAFVALIALATVMIVVPGGESAPGAMYAQGMGQFLALIIGEDNLMLAVTFGAMALSTFVFDTLDSGTRLGRYVLQELTGKHHSRTAAIVATAVTVGTPLAFLLTAEKNSYQKFWSLFGTSNQLLAAMTLLAVTVWLRRDGKRVWYTFVPMLVVLAVTVTSLVFQARALASAKDWVGTVNGVVSLILLALASTLVFYGARAVRRPVAV